MGSGGLYVCLMKDDVCISSIALSYGFATSSMEISSETKEDMQGKKYNKLLRFVAFLVCPMLTCNGKKIIAITSTPINPISAYTLLKHFSCHVDPKITMFMMDETTNNGRTMFDAIKIAFEKADDEDVDPTIYIPIDKVNYSKVTEGLQSLLTEGSGLSC